MAPRVKLFCYVNLARVPSVPLGWVVRSLREGALGECGGTLYVANPPGRVAPTYAPPVYLLSISTGTLTYIGSLRRFFVIVLLHI